MNKTIALAAGGTAGHIEPALATAQALLALKKDLDIFLIGTERGLEKILVPKAGLELQLIEAKALPRKFGFEALLFPYFFIRAKKQAKKILRDRNVSLVIGFGAYVSFPVYLAARSLNIPVIIHEGNAKPGIANKFFYKRATRVFQCFDDSLPNAVTVGMPLRSSIAKLNLLQGRKEGIDYFGLNSQKPTILVFGGSQGAVKINDALKEVIGILTAAGYQVLHAVGPNKPIEKTFDIDPDYHPVAYIDRMDLAYAVADLVVSRSGAMTVSEVTALGKPAIFIPFASGNGEQSENIRELISNGAALTISDKDLTGEALWALINETFRSEKKLSQISENALKFGRRDADQKLARAAIDLLIK